MLCRLGGCVSWYMWPLAFAMHAPKPPNPGPSGWGPRWNCRHSCQVGDCVEVVLLHPSRKWHCVGNSVLVLLRLCSIVCGWASSGQLTFHVGVLSSGLAHTVCILSTTPLQQTWFNRISCRSTPWMSFMWFTWSLCAPPLTLLDRSLRLIFNAHSVNHDYLSQASVTRFVLCSGEEWELPNEHVFCLYACTDSTGLSNHASLAII